MMTSERIAELCDAVASYESFRGGDLADMLSECIDEIERLRHLVAEAGRMLSVVTLDNEVDFASWTEVIEAAEEITGDMLG